MKHILYLLLIIFCLHGTRTYSQPIPWNEARPLVWSDFQSNIPAKQKRYVAATFSHIADQINYCTLDSINVTVTAIFNPYRSYKMYGNPGPYLLQHEQGHFDITELYARKLRKEVAQAKQSPDHDRHTRGWFSFARRRKLHELRHCQHLYDKQTRHSRNKEEQQRWNKKIVAGLAELHEYAP